MKQYVLGFAFSEDLSQVLLIEKNRPAYQAGKLNGIGGKVEASEEPFKPNLREEMIREFKEEVGIITTMDNWTHVGHITNIRRTNEVDEHEWLVWVYASNSIDISQMKQMESEVPKIVNLNLLHQMERMSNLDVIIPYCVNQLSGRDNARHLLISY